MNGELMKEMFIRELPRIMYDLHLEMLKKDYSSLLQILQKRLLDSVGGKLSFFLDAKKKQDRLVLSPNQLCFPMSILGLDEELIKLGEQIKTNFLQPLEYPLWVEQMHREPRSVYYDSDKLKEDEILSRLKELGVEACIRIPILMTLQVGKAPDIVGFIIVVTDELDEVSQNMNTLMADAFTSVESLIFAIEEQRKRMEADMEAAAKIQQNFLPDRSPELPGYEFAGMSIPRGGVGGDYYDYIDESNGCVGVVIADVSGKGTQAALLMATFRAILLTETKREHDLETITKLLNTLIYESSPEEKYVTFFYGRLYPETRTFEYINAGHNPPIIMRRDGQLEDTQGHSAFVGSLPPELFELIMEVENNKITLDKGDLIVFYTDGVTDTTNLDNERFGKERLESIVKKYQDRSAEELKDLIYEKVIEFQGDAQPFDDLTLVVLKVH